MKIAIVLCITGIAQYSGAVANLVSAMDVSYTILERVPEDRSREKSGDLFENARKILIRETRVPLRLPNLAVGYKDTSSLSAIVEAADATHYYIQIATTPDCLDGTNCHVGSIIGSIERISVKKGPKIPVKLALGIKGFFVDSDCGAHCDDSSINWKEGEYYYSINLRAAKKEMMIKLANSAINRRSGN